MSRRLLALHLFDLRAGNPTAVRVLVRHLGPSRTVRALACLLRRKLLRRDPLRVLPPAEGERDRLSRHQFAPVVMLDDVLRRDLHLDTADAGHLLAEVVAETGARFLASTVVLPAAADWARLRPAEREAFARGVVDSFFNATVERISAEPGRLDFDVCRCRFVELAAAVGRPELAALFCAADSCYFDRPDSPVVLERSATLASGGAACGFRFRLPSTISP